ncbi:hypothetical protein [Pseudoalteromonas sp. G4]|uniref:hypothetical protein n=1 Tax=Pseudoalteromonas sp. G4 TaxID=2992761 RepID=UPI00237DA324|nr:hypothetical protein [Pseudoalteromonas sp. G4]MDE3273792.1 hypothetical protein [Pseudoalteromonas sp. G4]
MHLTQSWFIPLKTIAFSFSNNIGQYATGYKTPSEFQLQDYGLTDVNSFKIASSVKEYK